MKRKCRIIAVTLCLAFLVCSCSQKETAQTTKLASDTEEKVYQSKLDVLRPMAYGNVEGLKLEKNSYITIIGRASDNSYWSEVEAGAKQAVADINEMLGYEGNDKVRLNFSAPKHSDDVDEQINILDEELARYPIAVGIAAIDATACKVQFDLARENSIPIVMFDSGSEYKDVAATCSTNNKAAAETAAVKLATAIEEVGEVAVFVQDSSSMTATRREQAFLNKLKSDYPNISAVSVYRFDELEKTAAQIAEEQKVDASGITQADVIRRILEKHPNLKGIFTTNLDVTQEVVSVLDDLNRTDLKVVGFDGGKEQLQLLEDGKLEGLVVQNPYGMGYATVVAIARASLEMGNEAFVDSGYTWVTKDNMDKTTIQRMMY